MNRRVDARRIELRHLGEQLTGVVLADHRAAGGRRGDDGIRPEALRDGDDLDDPTGGRRGDVFAQRRKVFGSQPRIDRRWPALDDQRRNDGTSKSSSSSPANGSDESENSSLIDDGVFG